MEEFTMRFTQVFNKATIGAGAFALTIAMGAALAAEGLAGKYETTDTNGKPFTISLAEDGTATGNRAEEGLQGKWKADGNAAVITWDSGWVTKITKEGDSYKKSAEKDGKPAGSPSDAKKVE
jgi:hypothetical protein